MRMMTSNIQESADRERERRKGGNLCEIVISFPASALRAIGYSSSHQHVYTCILFPIASTDEESVRRRVDFTRKMSAAKKPPAAVSAASNVRNINKVLKIRTLSTLNILNSYAISVNDVILCFSFSLDCFISINVESSIISINEEDRNNDTEHGR
jgi:hypothetical protein